METRFKALLEVVEFDEATKNVAILAYFDNQDDEEFEVDGKSFFVFDKYDVEDMLRDSAREDCKKFIESVGAVDYGFRTAVECSYIAEYIDVDAIVELIVDENNYDSLPDFRFLGGAGNYYVYEDDY